MNHYKKSSLLDRIGIVKEDLAKIEKDNNEAMEKFLEPYRVKLTAFIKELNPQIVSEFNEYYKKIILRGKLANNAYSMITERRARKEYIARSISEMETTVPIKIAGEEVVTGDCAYSNRIVIDFKKYLKKNHDIKYVEPTIGWFGIHQDEIDRKRKWLETFETELNCIAEKEVETDILTDNTDDAYLNHHSSNVNASKKALFEKTNMISHHINLIIRKGAKSPLDNVTNNW